MQTVPAAVSAEQARIIANRRFKRPEDSGCFLEERGDYWFVAPPYTKVRDSERAGVYVHKLTGRIVLPEER